VADLYQSSTGDTDKKGDLLYHIPPWEGKKSLSYILPRCHFVTQERAMDEGREKGTQSKPHPLASLYAMTVVYQYEVPFRQEPELTEDTRQP
jgi:hypothetical protein